MNLLTFVTVLLGSGLTWFMDASVRKQAKKSEKWIAATLLLMAVGFLCLKKYNIPIVFPADLLIRWIVPWMKQYITGG